MTSLSDGAGNRVQLTLDSMGNVTRQETRNSAGALISESNRAFDALNRLASVQRDTLSPAMTFQYDRGGNLTALTDALGRITTSEFDNLDRKTKDVLPLAAPTKPGTTIGYGYDFQDRLVSVTDPRKLTTRYTLDGLGQRKALISPDTNATSYDFDNAGNLVSSQDGRGVTTSYRYDAAQRLTKMGESTFEYGKDGSSATGRLTAMIDQSGDSSFSYDGYGRPQAITQTIRSGTAAKQFTLSYKYGTSGSSTGHVTSMTYPSGNRIEIGYGVHGKAISLALVAPDAASPTMILSNIEYAPLGAVQGWTWGSQESLNVYRREFDSAGRIKSYPFGPVGGDGNTRTISYDNGDRIISTAHAGTPDAAGLDQSYAYDDLDRLTGVEGANVSQAFEYDANGNRIQARVGSGIYANTIDPMSNRLTGTTGPVPAKTNTYDNAGNLTNDGTVNFSYGTNGRLEVVEAAGVTTRYRYNGFGERVEKAGTAGQLTFYVYDLAGRLIGEYDGDGYAIQETVYLGDLPVAVLKSSGGSSPDEFLATEVFGVYADQILTPRVIIRLSDNRIVWRWDNADPFGLQQPDESPDGLQTFNYNPRFPGQLYDKETNNHYNYYRDYDPQTGRYVQSDPIGLAGGLNTYAYVGSSPLGATDRFGLACPPQLKASGQCIDSSNYVPTRDGTKTVAGDAATDSAALANMRGLDISDTDENFGVINMNNIYTNVSGTGAETNQGYAGSININPLTTKAICHSHPKGDTYSSAPGYGDDGVVNGGYPNYIIRNGTIGVVERLNGQYQYRILRGRLTRPERRATEAELDNYQKRACGCNG